MIDSLGKMPMVKMAGLIGRFFHIDPIVVLDSSHFNWAARTAAYRYVAEKEREQKEAEYKQRNSASGSRPSFSRPRRRR